MASAMIVKHLKYKDGDKDVIDPIMLDVDVSQETGRYIVNGIA